MRKEVALAMLRKRKGARASNSVEQEVESKAVAERHELATLERRVLRFGVALAEGMSIVTIK